MGGMTALRLPLWLKLTFCHRPWKAWAAHADNILQRRAQKRPHVEGIGLSHAASCSNRYYSESHIKNRHVESARTSLKGESLPPKPGTVVASITATARL